MSSSKHTIQLKELQTSDLAELYQHSADKIAQEMAAFGSASTQDEPAFKKHWLAIKANPDCVVRTIWHEGECAGFIAKFIRDELPELAYWIDRSHWGKGIATQALAQFLTIVEDRPLYASLVADNVGSAKVLERNGFTFTHEVQTYSNVRKQPVQEKFYRLD